jgi:uncharacterized protein YidB (DUF937 family)
MHQLRFFREQANNASDGGAVVPAAVDSAGRHHCADGLRKQDVTLALRVSEHPEEVWQVRRSERKIAAEIQLEPKPIWNVAAAVIQRQERNMSRGMPSMTALLGLLALAGYQNRDRLAELLKGAGSNSSQPGASTQQGPLGGLLGSLSAAVAGGGVGGLLGGGLGELLDRFKQNGQGDAAESWINKCPNKELPPPLKQAIGPDVLAALEQQTGLSQEELLARLSRELPSAIDQYTPDGRIPA